MKGINFKGKVKTIKLSEYFEIIKPKYVFLKIVPHKGIRNYDSSNIVKSMTKMYKNILNKIERKNKHFSFYIEAKCSFFIDIRKNDVSFYLIVPDNYKNLFKQKIAETWGKVEINELEAIEEFSKEASMCQLYYKRDDALSLEVDKKSNEPLNTILSVMDIMEDKDRIGVYYNFMPKSQVGWKQRHKATIDKVKRNIPVDREVSILYCLKIAALTLTGLLDYFLSVFSDLVGSEEDKNISMLEAAAEIINSNIIKPSLSTTKKGNISIIDTQIIAFSESEDYMRKLNNMLGITGAYKPISGDNELVTKKYKNKKKKTFDFTRFKIPKAAINTASIDECSRFIQIPGRNLLQEYRDIEQIKTLETKVPEELQHGTKFLGVSKYRDGHIKAYLTTHKDYKNLAIVVIAPTRSGKTTLLGSFAKDSVNAGECVIYLDYIENCQASDTVKKFVGYKRVLELDLSNLKKLEGLGYNEAITNSDDPMEIYKSAKKQANQFAYFINTSNSSKSTINTDMSSKMDKYLSAACIVVFAQGGAFKDVFDVLQNHHVRHRFIDSIPHGLKPLICSNGYIDDLLELDEWSKETAKKPSELVGTRTHLIMGVLDRLSVIRKNTAMEIMLQQDIKNNINLVNEMEKNQAIIIKIPESEFETPEERDVVVTYWLTKIWMSAQIRAKQIPDRYKRKTVTVFLDELAQLENAERFVGSKLNQTAKFAVKFIISTMYINELKIREVLRTSNTSYIMIAGAEKSNFKDLKEELEPFGFTLEDLQNLKPYNSLNYMKCDNGFAAFITDNTR